MAVLAPSSIINIPLLPIVKLEGSLTGRGKVVKSMQFRPLKTQRRDYTLTAASLQPIHKRRISMRSSTICSAALNARCSGAAQSQTITREAPTITQAPVHIQEKSPQLDDGGTGFPPRDDGGGGGGGGGGGNWSGGFFFFGFLAFLGFLKDKESEGDYNDRSR